MALIFDYSTSKRILYHEPAGHGGWGISDRPTMAEICPFCKVPTFPVFDTRNHKDVKYYPAYERDSSHLEIKSCLRCGWWQSYKFLDLDGVTATSYGDHCLDTSLLRTFTPEDVHVPLETLINYLLVNPKQVHGIHWKKFELLVSSVFGEFFKCKARHVGRSGDGGIDIIAIDGDRPFAIQVKLKESAGSYIPVRVVREFLGGMQLEGFSRGAIVTAADRFSRQAKAAAKKAIEMQLVEKFDLFDFQSFLSLFTLVHKNQSRLPWMKNIPDQYKHLYAASG